MKKKISILGSTGSIGKSSLEIINLILKSFNIILLICKLKLSRNCSIKLIYINLVFCCHNVLVYNKVKIKIKIKIKILNKFDRCSIQN